MTDERFEAVRANYQDLVRSLIQSMLAPMARQIAYVRRASRRKRLRYRSTVMRMEPIRFRAVREGWEARMDGVIDAPLYYGSFSAGWTARTRKAASIMLYRWRRRMERYYAAKRPVPRDEE